MVVKSVFFPAPLSFHATFTLLDTLSPVHLFLDLFLALSIAAFAESLFI